VYSIFIAKRINSEPIKYMKTFDNTEGIRLDRGEHVSIRYVAKTKEGLYVVGNTFYPVGDRRGPRLKDKDHGCDDLKRLEDKVKALGIEVEYEKHLNRAIYI
jgi:hypothetical protein